MMQKQGFSYENLEKGAVSDPLTLKSFLRRSNRTKRRDKICHNSGKKRRSFFRPSSTDIDENDVQFEEVKRGRGRQPKKAPIAEQ
jgi:hypothetical protein